MRSITRARLRCSGLTLVELLFSLGLLALLAGLAVPGFQAGLRSAAVRSAAFELAADLQQARASAILESRPALLCPTDTAGNCLDDGAGTGWRSFLELGTARRDLASQSLPAGVVLRATRSPIRFWPSSAAASAGTLTICDARRIAKPRAIVISVTGRARMDIAGLEACGS